MGRKQFIREKRLIFGSLMHPLRGTTVTRVINYKSWVAEVMKKRTKRLKYCVIRYSSVINHFAIKGAIIFSLSLEIFLNVLFFHDKRSIGHDKLDIKFIIVKYIEIFFFFFSNKILFLRLFLS